MKSTKLLSDRYLWCEQNEKQSHYHPFVNCVTRVPQIREMQKGVGALCEWKHPRAPRVALLFDDNRAARAVLAFLRNTEVGQMDTMPPSGAERVGGEYAREKGGEKRRGGTGLP